MSPHETRFRQICRGLLAIGVKPTPTKLNKFLGRTGRHKTNNINGREARWRREELLAAGWAAPSIWTDPYNPATWSRWEPPR
jgi:hypothetical protein